VAHATLGDSYLAAPFVNRTRPTAVLRGEIDAGVGQLQVVFVNVPSCCDMQLIVRLGS